MRKKVVWILSALTIFALLISPVVFSTPQSTYAASGNVTITDKTPNNTIGIMKKERGDDHGGKGRGRGHHGRNHHSSEVVISILAEWSGISSETLTSVKDKYQLSIPALINTVVLMKASGIDIDKAAGIVASGELRSYVEKNGIRDKFMETRRELARYIHRYMEKKHEEKEKHGRRKAPGVKGRIYSDFIDILSTWSGIGTDTIQSIVEEYSLNPARTINAVVLAKVGNISLSQSASIVVAGELREYLEENGLIDAFKQARQEIVNLLKEKAQEIKETAEEKVIEALSKWSGFDKEDIQKLIEKKNIPYAITVVVLAKVSGISLQDAKNIVDNGKIMEYLRKNNLFMKFKQAKAEIWRIIRDILRP